jgi:nucleotide-binding universal stress UspA family protein
MIKDIAVLLEPGSEAAGRYALSAARSFASHLTAIALAVEPTPSVGFTEASAAFAVALLDKARDAARHMLETTAAQARDAGIATATELVEATLGEAHEIIGRRLREFDLAVIGQPTPNIPGHGTRTIEAALFGSGRPLLIVPYIQREPLRLDTVLVAWDGGIQAARALGDAMPLLTQAKRVEVVTVGGHSSGADDEAGSRVARHLVRHAIRAEARVLPTGDVASTLLSYAADIAADLVVMGGYGHSRFREVILGGATRGILQAMTLPALMSH